MKIDERHVWRAALAIAIIVAAILITHDMTYGAMI